MASLLERHGGKRVAWHPSEYQLDESELRGSALGGETEALPIWADNARWPGAELICQLVRVPPGELTTSFRPARGHHRLAKSPRRLRYPLLV